MRLKILTKLILAMAAVALLATLLISLGTRASLGREFQSYIRESQERQTKDLVDSLRDGYQIHHGWSKEMVSIVGSQALKEGLMLKVLDEDDHEVWNVKSVQGPAMDAMLAHMKANMTSLFPDWTLRVDTLPYLVFVGGRIVGRVDVGYCGPFYYQEHDLHFIATVEQSEIWMGLLTLLLAVLAGLFLSRMLSRPISQVTSTAQRISEGDLGQRVNAKSSTTEIRELSDSVNRMADTLAQQEALRRRLVGDVAHELRTPLAALQSHLELLLDGIWEPTHERLASCHEEAQRLGRLVSDLQQLIRVETSAQQIVCSQFDLGELIAHEISGFAEPFQAKGVYLHFTEVPLEVVADRDRIGQVLSNLLSNSLKYTRQGGIVTVSVLHEQDQVGFGVHDTGVGISSEDLPHIFERFYRVDKSRTRLTGGAGIGLTITQAIVEAHGGRITVASTPEVGSQFTVLWPSPVDH